MLTRLNDRLRSTLSRGFKGRSWASQKEGEKALDSPLGGTILPGLLILLTVSGPLLICNQRRYKYPG